VFCCNASNPCEYNPCHRRPGAVRRARRAADARTRSFRRLLLFALFLTFDLIMFGAVVRVTDAGPRLSRLAGLLWQGLAAGALETIRSEAAARPHGPVTEFKAWVEMLHRYIAAGLA
jgi:cytochrome c oxidase assembly protein subunit 15